MPREVEGLENLNRILTLPIGSKFGMFADNSMNLFKAAGYIDRVAKTSECSFAVDTVISVPSRRSTLLQLLLRLHGSPCGIRGHSSSGPKWYRDILR